MTAEALHEAVRDGLRSGEPVRIELDGGGVAFVDHAAPLLAVHRCPGEATGDPALDARAACAEAHQLVTTQPAYVVTSEADPEAARRAVGAVAEALAEAAGPPLVVEVWSPLDAADHSGVDPFDRAPGFTIYTTEAGPDEETIGVLCDALSGIEESGQGADVDHVVTPSVAPPGLPPLEPGWPVVGLAVDAVFHNARDGEFYPLVLGHHRQPAVDGAGCRRWPSRSGSSSRSRPSTPTRRGTSSEGVAASGPRNCSTGRSRSTPTPRAASSSTSRSTGSRTRSCNPSCGSAATRWRRTSG